MASALTIVQKRFPEVSKIIDSRKQLTVEVTGRDVSAAKAKNHESCAMAVACKRKLGLDGIIVSIGRAYLVKGTKAVRFSVPQAVAREIVAFDRGSDFVPGTYHLTKIQPYEKVGARLDRKSGPHNGKGQRRVVQHRTEGIRAVLGSKEDE